MRERARQGLFPTGASVLCVCVCVPKLAFVFVHTRKTRYSSCVV